MAFLKNYFWLFLILILSIPTILPLFQPGFFPMHDDEQVARLFDLDQVLKAGHIPPRIVPNLGFGYGYPFFNFYPPFVYYVAEIFHIFGVGYIDSIKLMIGLGFVLSGIAMYIFAKEHFGELGGLVSAIAYIYVPYHAVDVYVRGALPEFWSFVWIPLLFWSFFKLANTENNKYIILSGLFTTGLILTHNLIAIMSGIFLAIYILFLFFKTNYSLQFIKKITISIIIGLGLSAYFWMPSFFEKKYTLLDDILTVELANYNHHFVYLRQLLDSPWGYGGSLFGLYDGLSFEIGKLHIVGAAIAAIYSSYLFFKKKKLNLYVLLALLLFGLSIFMMTFYSKFIWDVIQPLSYIQFPWRFLLFCGFFASFVMGYIIQIPKDKKVQIAIAVLFIVLTLVMYSGYFKPEKFYTSAKDYDYTNAEKIRWHTSKLAFEYVPKGIATKKSDINTTQVDIDKNSISKSSYKVIRGNVNVEEISNLPHYKEFKIAVNDPAILQINTFSFPNWTVYINDKEAKYSDNNKLKLLRVPIPEGNYIIKAKFEDTPIRTFANTLSIITIVGLVIYSLKPNFIHTHLVKNFIK